ncbi:MAG: type II secretion system protein GspM [Gammaproteobacteria bacterium]|jgi:MSHA biogenesis protein MshJ
MNARLARLQERIDGLTLRERTLIFVALVAVVAFLWYALLMQPLERKQEILQSQVASTQSEIDATNQAIQMLLAKRHQDPDAENRRELTTLQSEIGDLDRQLSQLTAGLIGPEEMTSALRAVLSHQKGLRLISVESIAARPLFEQAESSKDKAGSARQPIYTHGLRLTLEGSYLAALDYLKALEALKWRFFWDRVEIKALDYPNNRITIIVHTLSLREGWIGA